MSWLTRARDWFYAPVTTAAVAAAAATSVQAPTTKASSRPAGTDGVTAYGGYLQSGEDNSDLSGAQKWLTYTRSINTPIVATGVRYFGNLLAGTKWHAEPNEAGGADAARGAEICEQGLLHAQMGKPWPLVVRKASLYRLLGFSLHATGIKRRPDGMVVYSAIEHRPQHSIERWLRKDEQSAWESVEQRTESGSVYPISLDECFYCVDDTLTDSPDGVGLLRHVVEYVRRLQLYESLEGAAYQSDMGGTPIGWAPLEELFAKAREIYPSDSDADVAARKAHVDARIAGLVSGMENRIKTPEIQQFMLFDSDTFRSGAEQTPSGAKKWGLDVLRTETGALSAADVVIKRIEFQIARVLGIEFALVGSEGGSYSMHADKTSMFATTLSVTLAEMSAFATSQLARRLVRLNGLDPDTATPTLVAEPISTESVMNAALALQAMASAALAPRDPARNVLRSRMQLPPEPEPAEDALAPRATAPLPPDDGDDVPDAVDESADDPDGDEIEPAGQEAA